MELKDVGMKDAEIHYGGCVGDDDVDDNDDNIDGDGVANNVGDDSLTF